MPRNTNNTMAAGAVQEATKLENFINCITFDCWRNPKPRIAVLRLVGPIGKVGPGRSGLSLDTLNDSIEDAFSNSNREAVILVINSPGGSPVQAELIAARIMELSKETNIPVYSIVEDIAASGGYWLACAGREIYASKSSIIGSIGVITAGFGFVDTMKKLGMERRVYTQGDNKSVLDPFLPAQKKDISILLKIQKHAHEHFINHVKASRKGKLTQNDEILFNGEFWSGITAEDFGLIDGIDNMYSFIKKRFGDKVKIDYIKPKESWVKKRFMSQIDSESIINAFYDKITEEQINSKFRIY